MKCYVLSILTLLGCCSPALADRITENPVIASAFANAKAHGTFVLFDAGQNTFTGHNGKRAAQRFSPASTFKIPHSLIGLSSGAVTSVDEVFFHYSGQAAFLASWKHDMNLREALPVSNVLAYQELARRIGLDAERAQLKRLAYGNADVGKRVDHFWLDGSLTISAIEQARFLARLASGSLPYPANQQAATREISKLESGEGWALYGKTGWSDVSQPGIGWFVGWLEKDGRIYSFALNMDIRDQSELPQRVALAKASLRALGLH